MVKSDKCMNVSQLLGARARAAPHVYDYDNSNQIRITALVSLQHWSIFSSCRFKVCSQRLLLSDVTHYILAGKISLRMLHLAPTIEF